MGVRNMQEFATANGYRHGYTTYLYQIGALLILGAVGACVMVYLH